jgi:hypothetical protein
MHAYATTGHTTAAIQLTSPYGQAIRSSLLTEFAVLLNVGPSRADWIVNEQQVGFIRPTMLAPLPAHFVWANFLSVRHPSCCICSAMQVHRLHTVLSKLLRRSP